MIVFLQFIASLTLLVLIHEFGHFISAKIFGIRVEKFRIFFDPWRTLFHFRPKGSDTDYGVGWLPLGGYVKIAGMIDESLDKEQMAQEPQPWEFRSHPAWQRLIVMAAGVIMNVLLAVAIYSGVCYTWGRSYLPCQAVETGMQFSQTAKNAGFCDGDILLRADQSPIVSFDEESARLILQAKCVTVLRGGSEAQVYIPNDFMQQLMRNQDGFADYRVPFVADSVLPLSPAQRGGLLPGDRVLAVGGRPMYLSDVCITIRNNAEKDLLFSVLRAGDTLSLTLTPDKAGRVGVMMKSLSQLYGVQTQHYSLLQCIPAGINRALQKIKGYTSDLKYVFTPEGAQSLGGFGTVAQLFPSSFLPQVFWEMTAFLSVILAVMNILPIPALDGGHIMFLLYEMVSGRKPSQRFLVNAQVIGMAFLFMLLLFANVNDLFRFLFN